MISIFIALAGLAAQDETTAPSPVHDGWQRASVSFDLTIYGKREKSMAIPAVYTTRQDIPGILFLCDQSSYRVRIAEHPMNMQNVVHGIQKRNVPRVPFTLYIDDEKAFKGDADLWTELDAIAPLGRKPAAKLFNAVIKDQEAEYVLRNKKTRVALHLPPIDDSFRDFASACKALQSK